MIGATWRAGGDSPVRPPIAMVLVWNELARDGGQYAAALNSVFPALFSSVFAWLFRSVLPQMFGLQDNVIHLGILFVAAS